MVGVHPGRLSQFEWQCCVIDPSASSHKPAMISTMRFASDSLIYKGTPNRMEQWKRAKAVLQANPSLMSSRLLLLSLHNNPPLSVVEFMLSLNSQAAAIPKRGPTALQIAVRYNVSVEVIVCLLKACPFALLASDDSEFDSPLQCATHLRSQEKDLIEILSQPLSYWMNESHKERLRKEREMKQSNQELKPVQKKELNNIKAIAATIYKAQKRQQQALAAHRHELRAAELSKEAIMEELDGHQQERFKSQLIALDMKEKAMRNKNRTMERRIISTLEATKKCRSENESRQEELLQQLETTVQDFESVVEDLKGRTEGRIHQLESRMEQEFRMNEYHRTDTRLQLDHMEWTSHEAQVVESPPFVFATPMMSSSPFCDHDEAEEPLFGNHPTQETRRKKFWSPRRRKFDRLMSSS
jgi:hypothetical protein